jgi:hypothetical protein
LLNLISCKSWSVYFYLVQKTLFSFTNLNLKDTLHVFSLSSNDLITSDFCNSLNKFPYHSRLQNTKYFDLNFISNYNFFFYNNDYRCRSQFFWIASQNTYSPSEFFIQSSENPILKNVRFFDWKFRWLSCFYLKFSKYLKKKINFFFFRYLENVDNLRFSNLFIYLSKNLRNNFLDSIVNKLFLFNVKKLLNNFLYIFFINFLYIFFLYNKKNQRYFWIFIYILINKNLNSRLPFIKKLFNKIFYKHLLV